MAELVLIAGMSGAGRSTAADVLEDLGWFVIDNLPASLIPKVAELAGAGGGPAERVALVVGTGPQHADVTAALRAVRDAGLPTRVLFLDAATDALVSRYEATRRRHPHATDGRTLAEAIDAERTLLDPVRAAADVVVDTSDLNIHDLRRRITELFPPDDGADQLRVTVESFGFKHGLPRDVDWVIDCRFLPNPHWVDELRPLTGLDEPVRGWLAAHPGTAALLERLDALWETVLDGYRSEGRPYVTLAFGCTGGRHRSVAVAEAVADQLRRRGLAPTVVHRDLERSP